MQNENVMQEPQEPVEKTFVPVPHSEAFEWLESLALALAFTMVVLVFCFSVSRISGVSMEPTLQDGDQILLRTIAYTPQRGDAITTDSHIPHGRPLAKRVIGIAGDVIDIDSETGAVSVNGTVLDEPYISAPSTQETTMKFPLTVPEGCVFAMGDNRPNSLDSRYIEIGCIDARDIMGKMVLRLSPNMGKIE